MDYDIYHECCLLSPSAQEMLYHFTKLSDNLLDLLIGQEARFTKSWRTESKDYCSQSITVSGLTVLSQWYEPASITSLVSFIIPEEHMRLILLEQAKSSIFT